MKQSIQSKLMRALKKLRNLPRGRHSMKSLLEELRAMRISYSQFGEDLVVRNHFLDFDNSNGLFIDVGAYHPFKWSNTMLLSKLGWRGINIDCDPEKIACFDKIRPQDQNIYAAIAESPREMNWLEYSLGATNRLGELGENEMLSACGEKPIKVTPIKVMPLTKILDQSKFRDKHFHYLNIDCEGHDLAVLKGLDFVRYAPDLITVEALTKDAQSELITFLQPVSYQLTDIVCLTLFFKKSRPLTL
jgi:hypothetical protein